MISIVIPCFNDQLTLDRTIESILGSIQEKIEIVVCDDGSSTPIKSDYAEIVRHSNNIGVGSAIDTAVTHSTGEALVISGADMHYEPNGWLNKGVALLNKNRKTIWSTGCSGYNAETGKLSSNIRYGSKMIIKASREDIQISRRQNYPEDWRMLFRSRWYNKKEVKENQEVPSLLGACYFIDREWYNHLRGFEMHRCWGSLDSMIAMKSWLAGGSCRTATDIVTYHSFGREVSFKPLDWFIYNKILVVKTLFPEKEAELLEWIKDDPNYQNGLNLINSYPLCVMVEDLKDYFQSVFKYDYEWYIDNFGLR